MRILVTAAIASAMIGCGFSPSDVAPLDAASEQDASIDAANCEPAAFEYAPIATENLISRPGEPAAQTITPEIDFILSEVTLQLFTCKSNGLVDARVSIRPTAGDTAVPDVMNNLAVSLLVANAEIAESCVAGDVHMDVTFAFDVDPVLESGVTYAVVLEASGEAAGAINWKRSSTPTDPSDPYQGGAIWVFTDANGWQMGNPSLDLAFAVSGESCN